MFFSLLAEALPASPCINIYIYIFFSLFNETQKMIDTHFVVFFNTSTLLLVPGNK